MTESKHNNTKQHTTTGFARRALLLFTFLVACVGSVWGEEKTLATASFETEGSNLPEEFKTANEIILRVYMNTGQLYIVTYNNYESFLRTNYFYNYEYNTDPEWNSAGYFEFYLESDDISTLIGKGLRVYAYQGATLTKITYEVPPPDTFEDPNKSPNSTGIDFTKYLTNQSPTPKLDITKATALLNGVNPTYARFYVLHNGEPLDLSKNGGLLTIEGAIPEKQSPKKGIYGYYIYNSGNELYLDNISVKLNVEAGKFPEYQVICVLSTQKARTAEGNVVTEEPYWDVMFTYAFRNQVETKDQTGSVTWDAVAMTATIPTDDMAEKWGTSWSNLAQEQKILWYVTDGAGKKQPLLIGTERQNGVWTINLLEPFTLEEKTVVLTGQSTYDATSFEAMWNIWGNPAIYAPADKGYADAKDYKIVCEIADDPESTEPNVIYTLSIDKTQFAGQEKATIVKTTQQVKVSAGATSASIPLNLPEETKYVRIYIVDQNGDVKNNEFWVSESWQKFENTDTPGWYAYSESGLSLSGSITINRSSANLNEYQVIMVTSTEKADLNQYEPDYDTQTTFWFKYPVEDKDKWKPTAEVEWNPQSMQIVAPNIDMQGNVEGEKGAGYLEKNRQHYTLEWTVVDEKGNEQPLCIGDSRVDECWSFNIVANPFTLADDGKSLVASNDPNLNVITWNSWAAPQIFAPKNMTMKQIDEAGIKFVCKLYEDDEAGDDNMLTMTYTINIVRKEELGQLKDGGIYYEKIIEDINHTQTSFTFDSREPLQNAITAFQKEVGKKPTYVRIYLTRNDGAPLHPGEDEDENEQLIIENATLFENNPKYGYYFHDEAGVDLSDITATLKLPAGSFTYYNVMVAMSGDTDEIDFTADKFNEPDYDYIYAFKFVETSSFPSTVPVESLITHTKQLQVKTTDTNALIPLYDATTVSEFLGELGETGNFNNMASNYFHVRWFMAKKNDDGTYEKLPGSEDCFDAVYLNWDGTINNKRDDLRHIKRRNQGLYWNRSLVPDNSNFSDDIIKVAFTKPTDGNWSDYQVVVWMTNSDDGATIGTDGTLSREPDIKIQYIYSFVEEEIAPNMPFVHYQGEAYRYLKEKGDDAGAQLRDYITVDGDAWLQEYTWNTTTNSYEPISGNIRQGVHTWEYDIYVVPDEERKLILPFENYESSGQGLEPRAYIRWYDWKTDSKVLNGNFTFTKEGTLLKENDRGLFSLCQSVNLYQGNIGVTFTPTADFSESIDIACDVSKYSDGIVEINGESYLLHEPTLSNRYIFHIHPAIESADSLNAAKQRLEDAESVIKNGGKAQILYDAMSTLKEDKGKVIVSLGNNMEGEFALRFDHHNLLSYVLEDGTGGYVSANGVQWYAYIENDKGIWRKKLNNNTDYQKRIKKFKYADFTGGDNDYFYYYNLDGSSEPIKTTDCKKFHLIGYAGKADAQGWGNYDFKIIETDYPYAPVVHYELHFIKAPAIPVEKLTEDNISEDNIVRTDDYMKFHYDLSGIVDFDGNPETNSNIAGHEAEYYSTEKWYDAPSTSADNLTYVPFQWSDIQYGFCYPLLTSTIKNTYGDEFVSPEHGDYTILKSMNVDGISKGATSPYKYKWWRSPILYDYTHTVTDKTKYGSFLYTDASDESRSIATIPFTANLCNGSSIYFTAAVANMTGEEGGYIWPQLLIRVVGIKMHEDGTRERIRIVAFHTCDITTTGGSLDGWNQVYGMSTVSANVEGIVDFEAEVVNYANDTNGADFAIDQIVIYTSTAKVLLTQTGDASCKAIEDENSPSVDRVKVYMEADGLQSAFGVSDEPQPIYWRICDEKTGEVVKGPYMYPQYDVNGNRISDDAEGENTYGVTYMVSNYLGLSSDEIKKSPDTPELYGWYYDKEDDKYYFQIANKSFDALEEGKDYYVSVYDPNADIETNDDAFWGGLYFGAKSRCSIYSEFFVPRRQYVTYTYGQNGGEEGGDLMIDCGSTGATVRGVQMILKVPDKNEPTGFKNYTDFHYDFAFVPLATWKSEDATFSYGGNTYKYADLRDALDNYRGVNSSYRDVKGLADAYETENGEYYNLLNSAVKAGVLRLYCSEQLEHEFTAVGDYAVTCIPIEKYVNENAEEADRIEICAPFEVTFRLKNNGGPELELGFSDVTYPTTPTKYLRVVRVGLEQLENMQKNDYLLHIPVKTFKTDDDAQEKTGTLEIISPYLELLKYQSGENQTNDSQVTGTTNIYVATFEEKEISANKQYISINFHGAGVTPSDTYGNFKEGFTYRMFLQVKKKDAGDGSCDAGVEFLMKVVPEYVTWNDKGTEVTPNSNQNTNWNNDANWSRSKKEELYKTDTKNYDDNVDMDINSTPATFVPMKFTYVTIPSDNVAPILERLTIGNEGIYTEESMGNGATGNIQYDLMVRMEETCQDNKHTGYDTDAKIYDCEKFYGNWAKEIYFKPRAELVNQHYLTYEKVWVEKELTAGTWTLMSTPLQNTYAGDMYVPISGRQETEAFKKINFGEGYSRTLYPIYQKSWLQEGSMVYTMTNDVRANSYNAELKGGVTSTLSLWSHTYNDVTVDYSKWKGFAIRAHKKDQSKLAQLRLPKEDTQYEYYKWDGNMPTDGKLDAQTVDKKADNDNNQNHLATGKLFTDGTPNTYGLTYGVDYQPTANDNKQSRTANDGTVKVKIGEVQDAKDADNNYYLLVGNPYLCSINMYKFFTDDENKNILTGDYWTYEHNTIDDSYTTGSIKPLQSFFVKVKNDVINGDTNIKFTPDMMTDGNNDTATQSQSPAMRMTAVNDRGQSTAIVSVGDEARSVETLFDSNLNDVPMVYTVAEGQAVSVNQLTKFDRPIAFGVTCTASDEPVAVTFTDIAQLTSSDVFVVDAVTGEQTAIGEGSSVSVQPNDYGRYFLLPGTTGINDKTAVQKGIMVSVRGKVVTVTSGEALTLVRALSPDGTTVHQDAPNGMSQSFTLASGVYVIQAENAAGERQTVKILIKTE